MSALRNVIGVAAIATLTVAASMALGAAALAEAVVFRDRGLA